MHQARLGLLAGAIFICSTVDMLACLLLPGYHPLRLMVNKCRDRPSPVYLAVYGLVTIALGVLLWQLENDSPWWPFWPIVSLLALSIVSAIYINHRVTYRPETASHTQ